MCSGKNIFFIFCLPLDKDVNALILIKKGLQEDLSMLCAMPFILIFLLFSPNMTKLAQLFQPIL
jgi:hypothetical protein